MDRAPLFLCAFLRVAFAGLLLALLACDEPAPAYDVVINHGRVIDPESQLDAVRSIGIRNGKIVAVSKTPLTAPREIDASNRVVSPGFINLHSHSVAEAGYQLELLDGVTTVLEPEAGGFPIDTFGQQLGAFPLTHFGASVGHAWIRLQIIDPASIAASADYDEPFLPPAGIDFVLVGGSVAAESGAVVIERGSGKKLLGARKEVSGPSAR